MRRFWQMAGFAGAAGVMLALVIVIMTGSGAIVSRLAAIDAEHLARSVLTSLGEQFDLPGTPVDVHRNGPDRIIASVLGDPDRYSDAIDVFDPQAFEAREHFGLVKGYAVFTRFGQLMIAGGQPQVRTLEGSVLQDAADRALASGKLQVAEIPGAAEGDPVSMAVLIPLIRGPAVRGVASIEIQRHQLETLMKRGVQLVAMASALVTGLLGFAGLYFLARIARTARKAESQALFLANSDPATHLPNRRRFNEDLDAQVSRIQGTDAGLVLILLDIDNFKGVNDTFGQAAGDVFLSLIGKRLASFTGDNELYRISGDQFAILRQARGGRAEIEQLIARIQSAIANQFTTGSVATHITLSIGIAFSPGDAETGEDLMRAAELALRSAKADGRNTFRFHDLELSREAAHQIQFQGELARSIAHDSGLQLAYQPQVEASTGRLVGFEALLRWEHPRLGTIPPTQFIPVAERCGLIHDLGAWALRRACNAARDWPAHLTIAVNLSALQLRDSRLPRLVESVLRETGLDPKRLELEVTESVMLQDTGLAHQAFEQIQALGVGFAMDDFGTGYSSLSYLTRLPLTKLKIDKAFVDRYGAARRDKAVVDAMISMAHNLDMQVLAEGVETQEQANTLCAAGCTLMQGYFFGRPTINPESLIENELLGFSTGLRAAV